MRSVSESSRKGDDENTSGQMCIRICLQEHKFANRMRNVQHCLRQSETAQLCHQLKIQGLAHFSNVVPQSMFTYGDTLYYVGVHLVGCNICATYLFARTHSLLPQQQPLVLCHLFVHLIFLHHSANANTRCV